MLREQQYLICSVGGWDPETGKLRDDLAGEIAQAFANVDLALKTAGGQGWSQVYRINMYLAVDFNEEVFGLLVENLKTALPDHAPICTAVGVRALAFEGMRIEIEAIAHVGPDSRMS